MALRLMVLDAYGVIYDEHGVREPLIFKETVSALSPYTCTRFDCD